jgi:UDP-N-acetylglucosamine acyltransferase
VTQDIPPFVMVDGLTSLVVGLNRVGLRRNGYSESDILQLKAAYRLIYRSGLSRSEILSRLAEEFSSGPAAAFREFLADVKRGLIRDRQTPPKSTIRIFSQDRTDESGDVREAV